MSLGTYIAVYFVVWWITLFAVLPIGVASQHEGPDFAQGTDPGAPVQARMARKVIITSILALPGTVLVTFFLTSSI